MSDEDRAGLRTPITHVAIRHHGRVFSLPPPNRHHDVIWLIARELDLKYVDSTGEDQGFLDASGRYLNRKQALLSALLHNQVKDPTQIRARQLFSEDLW